MKLWYYIYDNGDGSYGVSHYATKTEAQVKADEDEKDMGYILDECIGCVEVSSILKAPIA